MSISARRHWHPAQMRPCTSSLQWAPSSCACRQPGSSIPARYRHSVVCVTSAPRQPSLSSRRRRLAPRQPRPRPPQVRRRVSCFVGWSCSADSTSLHKGGQTMSMDNNEFGRGNLMTPRLIIGLAIALFGVVLVFDRLNLVVADDVLRWWPGVIIAIGAVIFTQSRRIGGGINGTIVMLIGLWLLLNSIGIVRVGFWEMFWPLVLIGIGVALVMQTVGRRTREVSSSSDRDNTLAVFAVMGG